MYIALLTDLISIQFPVVIDGLFPDPVPSILIRVSKYFASWFGNCSPTLAMLTTWPLYVFPGSSSTAISDLATMISKIYVSEIEIANVKAGQRADISIDALPGKTYKGQV